MQNVLRKAVKASSAVTAMASGGGHGGTRQQAIHTAGIVHGEALNCYDAVDKYIERMVTVVPGMKAMLLDPETVRDSSPTARGGVRAAP